MTRWSRIVAYGDDPDKGPCHALAVAVVERTLADAAGGPSVRDRKQRDAIAAMEEPPNNRDFSFWWWLSIAYPNPERIQKLFLQALRAGDLVGLKYRIGRRRVVPQIKIGSCVTNLTEYNAN